MAIEPYMDLPWENPEGYAYGSNLRLVDRLQGKLLLIQGTSDVNATFSATVKLTEALARAGKSYDLCLLPEEDHWPIGGMVRYWMQRMSNYFVEHLQP
jgi:dipeptidyl-peptidase-4